MFSFAVQGIVNASVNNITIDLTVTDRFLFLFSGTATAWPVWRMEFVVAGVHPIPFNLHLSSRYELISYSAPLRAMVDRLPAWATVAGEGEGMVRIDTSWVF